MTPARAPVPYSVLLPSFDAETFFIFVIVSVLPGVPIIPPLKSPTYPPILRLPAILTGTLPYISPITQPLST